MSLRLVGQEAHSQDCGFFAGYTALLRQQHGAAASGIRFSQEDVYRARNRFRNDPDATLTADYSKSLNVANRMVSFLDTLGCRGYFVDRLKSKTEDTTKAVRKLLRRRVARSHQDAVLILSIRGERSGHWVSIIQQSGDKRRSGRPLLKWGDKGDRVELLQKVLNRTSTNGKTQLGEDGDFGNKTYARVRQFQQQSEIRVDGVVGEQTWDELEAYIFVHFPAESEAESTYQVYDPAQRGNYLMTASESKLVEWLDGEQVTYFVYRADNWR